MKCSYVWTEEHEVLSFTQKFKVQQLEQICLCFGIGLCKRCLIWIVSIIHTKSNLLTDV